jgi:hypothetical protein
MENMDHVRERFEALERQTEQGQQDTRMVERRRRGWRIPWRVAAVAVLGLALARPAGVQAKIFPCRAGDVQCLIDAITTANANGEANTITLEAGTYTLTTVDNTTNGPNGLPSVTGSVTIKGAGADATSLVREASAPDFRLGHVAATGNLTLDRLTLRGGGGSPPNVANFDGGNLLNQGGTLTVTNTTLTGGNVRPGGWGPRQQGRHGDSGSGDAGE